jgi:hypothetical protein
MGMLLDRLDKVQNCRGWDAFGFRKVVFSDRSF